MTIIYKYRVFCSTSQTFQFVWGVSPPTVCPENSGHAIDSNSITVVDQVNSDVVTIREENIPTGGNYQATTVGIYGMTGPTGAIYQTSVSWPIPINALSIHFTTINNNEGDVVDLSIGPDTVIGSLTQDAPTGTTGINVSSSVTSVVMTGYELKLNDGVKTFDCGRVLSVDTTNNVVYIENYPDSTFLASSPTSVEQTVYVVKNFTICNPQKYTIGQSKIGGSYVPANTNVVAHYTLNSTAAEPKYITGMIEYLY